MIRIIETATAAVVAEAVSMADAVAILAVAPAETEIHAGDALAAAKADATARVVAEADRYGALLTAGYPTPEQESWPAKVIEARDLAAGATPSSDLHPIIMTESLSPADIAATVLAKAAPFSRASGAISGIRQAALERIAAAADEAGIADALAWAWRNGT